MIMLIKNLQWDHHDEVNASSAYNIAVGADATQINFTDNTNGSGIFADDDFNIIDPRGYATLGSLHLTIMIKLMT